jgi:hypothetical protein
MTSKKQNNVVLSYEGVLDFETIGQLIGKLQKKMKQFNTKVFLYKKVLSVMIESLENIYKYYSDIDTNDLPKGYIPTFKLIKSDDRFIVNVSNVVRNLDVAKLAGKIDGINSLDKRGLKKLYKDTITNGQFTEKGGAGLGFIEMAKISGDKLEYTIEKINNDFSSYSLSVHV